MKKGKISPPFTDVPLNPRKYKRMRRAGLIATLFFAFTLIGCTTTLTIDRYKTIENPQTEGIILIMAPEKERAAKLKDEIFSMERKRSNIEKGIHGFTGLFILLPFL